MEKNYIYNDENERYKRVNRMYLITIGLILLVISIFYLSNLLTKKIETGLGCANVILN